MYLFFAVAIMYVYLYLTVKLYNYIPQQYTMEYFLIASFTMSILSIILACRETESE